MNAFHAQSRNGSVIRIVTSRFGEVLSNAIGQPTSSSTQRTYLMRVVGSSAKERAPCVLPLQLKGSVRARVEHERAGGA